MYSTALTRLLLDHGFEIVQPSRSIRDRFGIGELNEPPDLDIRERRDRQGVLVSGAAESIHNFNSILRSHLHDVIIREQSSVTHPFDVEFPALSKEKLDDIRRSVTETMERHHYYKACGGNFSVAVDMAERLLEKGGPIEEVDRLFRQTVGAGFPTVGSRIDVEHVKLDGRVLHLGEALVEDFGDDDSVIEFSRIVKGEGTYDGLGTRREPGDRAVTEAKIGGWHYKTRYFSKDGRHKGTYINLNTPIELYPYGIRYVDLEVDICVWPSGRVGKVDEKKLESAAAEGIVTQTLVKTVKKKMRELMQAIGA
jgi:hypothetical protein